MFDQAVQPTVKQGFVTIMVNQSTISDNIWSCSKVKIFSCLVKKYVWYIDLKKKKYLPLIIFSSGKCSHNKILQIRSMDNLLFFNKLFFMLSTLRLLLVFVTQRFQLKSLCLYEPWDVHSLNFNKLFGFLLSQHWNKVQWLYKLMHLGKSTNFWYNFFRLPKQCWWPHYIYMHWEVYCIAFNVKCF